MVRTDNNPLTYVFSSASLDAAGQRWVAKLANYNFSLEYQKGKDNTVADFLSRVEDRLPEAEVEDYLVTIPQVGVKEVLDNAISPPAQDLETKSRLHKPKVEALMARPAKFASVNVTNWQREQKADPVLFTIVKNLRAPREQFREALRQVLDRKAVRAYVRIKDQLVMKNGLLYLKTQQGPSNETTWRFVVPQAHQMTALDGCHREAAHQGQKRTMSLMMERFYWPGMCRQVIRKVKNCARCRQFGAASPVAAMKPLTCSGPGELLHIDFTTIEETVPLNEKPVMRNVLVMQDHFSKYVVAYVVDDQTAETAAWALRKGYFSLFGAPAYLVSDQGKAFTSHVIKGLCELYGVQKLRTSSYHAQTNGQVERMNQTLIRMIGKLDADKKADWSHYLPELLTAYNATRSGITGYSPYYLMFGRRPRIPVDFQFPTVADPPHYAKLEESVASMQKRLKEAFALARQLTSDEAARQSRYYDKRAGAVALQPGDVVMVRTDRFVGKRKVKDRWADDGYVVQDQLDEDWPVYRVRCPPSGRHKKPFDRVIHRNRLLLIPPPEAEESTQGDEEPTQPQGDQQTVPNAASEVRTMLVDTAEAESKAATSSLLTRQGDAGRPGMWLNGEFRTKLWTQMFEADKSPLDQVEEEVSDPDSEMSASDSEAT